MIFIFPSSSSLFFFRFLFFVSVSIAMGKRCVWWSYWPRYNNPTGQIVYMWHLFACLFLTLLTLLTPTEREGRGSISLRVLSSATVGCVPFSSSSSRFFSFRIFSLTHLPPPLLVYDSMTALVTGRETEDENSSLSSSSSLSLLSEDEDEDEEQDQTKRGKKKKKKKRRGHSFSLSRFLSSLLCLFSLSLSLTHTHTHK